MPAAASREPTASRPEPSWQRICPYLLDATGSWRAVRPAGEHRCTAVSPAVPLPLARQRTLCLTHGHVECPTYLAAREARAAILGDAADPARGPRRPYPRSAPVVLERPGWFTLALSRARGSLPQVGLVLLMVLAAIALVLARFTGP